MFQRKEPMQIVRESEALVQEVQRSLEATEEFYRSLKLKPEKVRSTLHAKMGPKEAAAALAAYQQDIKFVEHVVAEEIARADFFSLTMPVDKVKKIRPMV